MRSTEAPPGPEYVEIEGIFMPRRVTREPEGEAPVGEVFRRDTERAKYRFNVTYDPKILAGPASKKTKRSYWKACGNPQVLGPLL